MLKLFFGPFHNRLSRSRTHARLGAARCLLALTVALAAVAGDKPAAEAEASAAATPHFQEVLRLLRAHLGGVTESELNAAMVRGLTESFGSRVSWGNHSQAPEAEPVPRLRRVAWYGDGVGYLGVNDVAEGLAQKLAEAKAGLRSSNELTGWVLDLRFSGGSDFRAAALAADQFVKAGRPLVRLDEVGVMSTGEGDAVCPVVILVNSRTRGAAEALAGALREAGPAVVLGSRTSGQAQVMRAFDLEQGGQLLIAGAPVEVGEAVSLAEGVIPDFEATFPLAQERLWLEDPYRLPEGENASTAKPADRFDEAALVAQHEGITNSPARPSGSSPADRVEPAPRLHDPALLRALSLLKGLARVRGGILR